VAEGQSAKGDSDVVEPTQAEESHARRVAESKATVPHAYFEAEAEAGPIGTGALVVAAAIALRDFPRLNASYRDGRFELHSRINIGVAIAAEPGLLYPTIQDADSKAAEAVDDELVELGRRIGNGEITQPELSGGTFSLADLSSLGISRADLVVSRGQAGILAIGARGETTRTLSLACDNRIVQAPAAAGFLARVGELIVA
jgi:pyruvate dehydrogenase E2 component (dihydrolipoamide acetyltransferase)